MLVYEMITAGKLRARETVEAIAKIIRARRQPVCGR